MEEPQANILLAAYNGEKYIGKQIDSILNQSYQDWILTIRDDGSTDGTVSIIEGYCKKDGRIHLYLNEGGEHGWQSNFKELLYLGSDKVPYIMFCDQDDIWFSDKIELFLQEIKELKIGGGRINFVYGDMEMNSLYDSFFTQRVYGCNMMFTRELAEKACKILSGGIQHSLSHDGLIVKVASANQGSYRFLKTPMMGYRRYSDNATAKQEFNISTNRVFLRLRNIKKLASDQTSVYVQAISVIDALIDESVVCKSCLKDLEKIRKSLTKGGIYSLYVWLKYRVSCGSRMRSISHLFVLVTGLHKEYL